MGKIQSIELRGRRHKIHVLWYYRPEETAGGRKVGWGRRGKFWRLFLEMDWGRLNAASPSLSCSLVCLQMFHGKYELFTSNHEDEIDEATIRSKAFVFPLDQYMSLAEANPRCFFTRVHYCVRAGWAGEG